MQKTHQGGVLPLTAVIPSILAAAKTATLGGASSVAGYGVKKAIGAIENKATKRKSSKTAKQLMKAYREGKR